MNCQRKKIKRGRMTDFRSCIREEGHTGRCSPDLMGMGFGRIKVLKIKRKGNPYNLWVVKRGGNIDIVSARDLISGHTSGIYERHGFLSKGSKSPEYTTVWHHWERITNIKSYHHRYYKGMPFFKTWNPLSGGSLWKGAKYILDNLGSKPGKGWTLDIIHHYKGFVPGNLRWVPRGNLQRRNQVHRLIFNVSDKIFAVEAKRRGYKKV